MYYNHLFGRFTHSKLILKTENMKTILVFSLRNSLGDCTNNGLTAKNNTLILFSSDTTDEEIFDYCKNGKANMGHCLRVVKRNSPYANYAEVVFRNPQSEGTYMAGGNYITTSDSRYSDIAGVSYPLPVHDRFETWTAYNGLSK